MLHHYALKIYPLKIKGIFRYSSDLFCNFSVSTPPSSNLRALTIGWLLQGDRAESVGQTSEPPFATMAQVGAIRDLFALLQTDLAFERIAQLPPRYRERYRDRIKDLTARVQHELEEYRKLLEAEYRAERSKRKGAR